MLRRKNAIINSIQLLERVGYKRYKNERTKVTNRKPINIHPTLSITLTSKI